LGPFAEKIDEIKDKKGTESVVVDHLSRTVGIIKAI
jgi:hypothetical protein